MDSRRRLFVLPVGSTEQHGPHLPLGTDTRIAVAVADALAARVNSAGDELGEPGSSRRGGAPEVVAAGPDDLGAWEAVVAPALAYGASGEHAGFAGTVSIGTAALTLVLVELVRSLGSEWSHAVVVNAHGGNADALRTARRTLDREGRSVTWWSPPPAEGGDAHAGRTETSLMLAIDAAAVRLDAAEAGESAPLAAMMPTLRAGGVKAVSANGVLGDPVGASEAEGHALFAAMVDDLTGVVVAAVSAVPLGPAEVTTPRWASPAAGRAGR